MPARSPEDWAISKLQQTSYGKFLHNGYPFLFYEPNAEADIGQVTATYLSGVTSLAGLHFAINMDPVQFSVYASSAARSHQAEQDPSTQPVALNAARSLLSVGQISVRTAFVRSSLVIMESSPGSKDGHQIGFVFIPDDARTPPANVTWLSVPHGLDRPLSATANCTVTPTQPRGALTQCTLEMTWTPGTGIPSLSPAASGATTSAVRFVVHAYAGEAAEGVLDTLQQLSVCATCAPAAMYHAAGSSLPSVRIAGALDLSGGKLCIGQVEQSLVLETPTVVCASVPGLPASAANLTLAAIVQKTGVLVLAAWEAQQGAAAGIFGGLWSYVASGKQPTLTLLAGPRYLQAGKHPMADALPAGETQPPWFALSADDAFCYNTESGNKQATPATCDQIPQATPFVLSASAGTAQAWLAQLAKRDTGAALTPCRDIANEQDILVHSVYDMGVGSCLALQRTPGNASAELFAVHLGIGKGITPPSATATCGLPAAYDGAALSRWQLT
jgi:hypothetical protein